MKTKMSNQGYKIELSVFGFLQMCWADTFLVGCGYTYYKHPVQGYSKLYVCNYGPGGNLIGSSFYKPKAFLSDRCSQFGLFESKSYMGLCVV